MSYSQISHSTFVVYSITQQADCRGLTGAVAAPHAYENPKRPQRTWEMPQSEKALLSLLHLNIHG